MVQGQTVRSRHTEDSEYAFAFSGKNRQQALKETLHKACA